MGAKDNKALTAMNDLSNTAYAYHKSAKYEKNNATIALFDDATINLFFKEMDTNGDNRISFNEFKSYMDANGREKFGSRKLFDKLKGEGKDYLKYCDIVSLAYVLLSGRPFCDKCEVFVFGLFFTCVRCFEREKDYFYNLCPSCHYAGKGRDHCDGEFLDPILLLRLKATLEQNKPKDKPMDSKASLSTSSSSNAIVVYKPRDPVKSRNGNEVSQLMQILAGGTTIAAALSQLCTIM